MSAVRFDHACWADAVAGTAFLLGLIPYVRLARRLARS